MDAIVLATLPVVAGFLKLVADNRQIKAGLNGQLDAKLQEVKDEVRDVKADVRDLKHEVRSMRGSN